MRLISPRINRNELATVRLERAIPVDLGAAALGAGSRFSGTIRSKCLTLWNDHLGIAFGAYSRTASIVKVLGEFCVTDGTEFREQLRGTAAINEGMKTPFPVSARDGIDLQVRTVENRISFHRNRHDVSKLRFALQAADRVLEAVSDFRHKLCFDRHSSVTKLTPELPESDLLPSCESG